MNRMSMNVYFKSFDHIVSRQFEHFTLTVTFLNAACNRTTSNKNLANCIRLASQDTNLAFISRRNFVSHEKTVPPV